MGQGTRLPRPLERFSKLLAALGLLLAASAGLLALWRGREDRGNLVTGPARWIWYTRQVQEPAPLEFRAWKDFQLEGAPPPRAPVRLFGDRQWSLEVNGRHVASGTQKPGEALRVLDLATWLQPGENRIAVEASSSNGVGGLLFWMDLGGGRIVVSDKSWEVERLPGGTEPKRPAAEWGKPPIYPWGYPRMPQR